MTHPTTIRCLATLTLLSLALAATPAAARDGSRVGHRSYLGDANSLWLHAGGGMGMLGTDGGQVTPAGRFVLGGGAYTFGVYATGGLEIQSSRWVPFSAQGVGGFGVHIPIPVVHPMFGVKVGGGVAEFGEGPTAMTTVGGQFGVIVREFDRRAGIRLLVEPSMTRYSGGDVVTHELFVTLAIVR